MDARFSQYGPTDPGMRIGGTFYPSHERRGAGSVVPKILIALVAMAAVKMIVGARHHGGGPRFSRRREAIAEFHRELHAQDEAAGATTKA